MYNAVDYAASLPAGAPVPAYDGGAAMHDIDDFVQHQGDHLLFVYGQWDPWTGGAFTLGSATDSLLLVQAEGTHGSEITRPRDRRSRPPRSRSSRRLDRRPRVLVPSPACAARPVPPAPASRRDPLARC